MAEEDIYGNKRRYEQLQTKFKTFDRPGSGTRYHCKNPANIPYFVTLCEHMESRDMSYARRNRLIQVLRVITYATEQDLQTCKRADVNHIMTYAHTRHHTIKSKTDFIKSIKYLWKNLFPVLDEEGLPDERLTPHAVRHLSEKIDISRQKARKDKLTPEEYKRLLNYFNNEPRIQSYITLAVESLGRPQEILYCKLKDVEYYTNYAKIHLNEHTKEGVGILQCIDSYPQLIQWINNHPNKDNPESYLFVHLGKQKKGQQLTPYRINQILKSACKTLKIPKPITCYSLKRNGVTFRRLRGDTDLQIQHAARWTSTKQMKVYDQSNQEDAFNIELNKRVYTTNETKKFTEILNPKQCTICNHTNSNTNTFCNNCKRTLDKKITTEPTTLPEMNYQEIKEQIKKAVLEEIRLACQP